ncbi:MAG: hypothetical protein ACRCRT_03785 [Cetobacterium somerae]
MKKYDQAITLGFLTSLVNLAPLYSFPQFICILIIFGIIIYLCR